MKLYGGSARMYKANGIKKLRRSLENFLTLNFDLFTSEHYELQGCNRNVNTESLYIKKIFDLLRSKLTQLAQTTEVFYN